MHTSAYFVDGPLEGKTFGFRGDISCVTVPDEDKAYTRLDYTPRDGSAYFAQDVDAAAVKKLSASLNVTDEMLTKGPPLYEEELYDHLMDELEQKAAQDGLFIHRRTLRRSVTENLAYNTHTLRLTAYAAQWRLPWELR